MGTCKYLWNTERQLMLLSLKKKKPVLHSNKILCCHYASHCTNNSSKFIMILQMILLFHFNDIVQIINFTALMLMFTRLLNIKICDIEYGEWGHLHLR